MGALTGKVVGGFELLEEIGRGGMGVVFKARQVSLDRFVAIKFLPKSMAQDEKRVQRFIREARAAGQLSHPNIVAAYDVGQVNGLYYIAMEYVDGTTAQKILTAKGPFPEKDAVSIGLQIADALKAAHARGILHRDVKPDNFLIDSTGRARLADLGLARFESDGGKDAHLTQDGTALGTPHYISPEGARGNSTDARSDLYSLGASLYMLVTGQTPFTGPTSAAIMVKAVTDEPRPLRELNPGLSPGLFAVVEKLMQKDPERRFQNADELIEALQKVQAGTYAVGTARHAHIRPRTGPAASVTRAGSPLVYAVLGGGAALVVLGLIIFLTRAPKPAPPPASASTTPPAVVAETSKKEEPAAQPDVSSPTPKEPDARGKPALEKEWKQALSEHTDAVVRKDLRGAARVLHQFIKDHPDAPQVPAAKEKLGAVEELIGFGVRDEIKRAKDLAEAGNLTEARRILTDLREHFPRMAEKRVAEALTALEQKEADAKEAAGKKDLAAQEEAARKEAAAREEAAKLAADQQRMEEAHKRAAALVQQEPRFQFDKAAQIFTGAAPGMTTETARQQAAAWTQRYARAGKCWEQVRGDLAGKRIEMPNLGQFRDPCTVTGCDEKGLSYTAPKLPPGQLMPWRTLTPANVTELAKAVRPPALDLGLLAFAVGAYGEAFELLNPEKIADAAEKALALDAWQRAKALGQEELAEQAFKAAKTAQDKQDRAAATQALARLTEGGTHAGTQFAKSHAAEIAAVLEWASGASGTAAAGTGTGGAGGTASTAAGTTTTPGTTVAGQTKAEPAEPNGVTPELAAELKKLGWETVEGNWAAEGNQKGVYRVKDGKLTLIATDAAAQVGFVLQKGARLSLWVRYQPIDDPLGIGRGIMKNFGREPGPGYGVSCSTQSATVYVPLVMPPWPMRKNDMKGLNDQKIPVKHATDWPTGEGRHQLSVSVRGESLDTELDAKKRSAKDLRDKGTVVLEIEGTAVVWVPQVKKL